MQPYNGETTRYCVQTVNGKVSGNTLTIYANRTAITVYDTNNKIGNAATYVAGDAYTIVAILCLGKK